MLIFIAALFIITKTYKQPKCLSADKWIKKGGGVHICNEILLRLKKDKIMPFAATWIQLEILILNEGNSKEKDRYQMISLLCGI